MGRTAFAVFYSAGILFSYYIFDAHPEAVFNGIISVFFCALLMPDRTP